MSADSRGFNPRMRYLHTRNTKYIMKSFWIAYHEVDEKDETKWVVYDGYTTFKDAWHDVMTYYQFKGMLPNYAWFIYGVQEDKTKVRLNHDGTPV